MNSNISDNAFLSGGNLLKIQSNTKNPILIENVHFNRNIEA